MRYALACLALAVPLAGCQTVQTGALVTCSAEAVAVSALADFKHAGKLSAGQIALVDKDIALVDPVCSASSPDAALTGAVQAAATELVNLAGSIH